MTTAATATEPVPQCITALEKANKIRIARAALKREIKGEAIQADAILADPPPETHSMSIGELLRSQRRWGRKKVLSFLRMLNLSESRQLQHLTDRQRQMIIAALRHRSDRLAGV